MKYNNRITLVEHLAYSALLLAQKAFSALLGGAGFTVTRLVAKRKNRKVRRAPAAVAAAKPRNRKVAKAAARDKRIEDARSTFAQA